MCGPNVVALPAKLDLSTDLLVTIFICLAMRQRLRFSCFKAAMSVSTTHDEKRQGHDEIKSNAYNFQ